MNLKQAAAARALEYVENGMCLGLGTGSTTAYFITLLGQKLQRGELRDIVGVPTSERTAERARSLHIPLTTLSRAGSLDLAVDGADEVDPQFNLIKGLGRALLREKIVEVHAARLVIIVDQSKLVSRLGEHVPLPVEIIPFEAAVHVAWLNTLPGCRAELWLEDDGAPVVTDNGNYLVRCYFEQGIADAQLLARALAERPGIVEHGLFLGMANAIVVAEENGVRVMTKNNQQRINDR